MVLAAGMSSRLGRPKQLLDLGGRPLLQHVVDGACATFDEVVVVLGHEAARVSAALAIAPPARVVVNPRFAQGMSTSLEAGLAALGREVEAAAILLGDQPGVTPELSRRLVSLWRSSGATAVRPRFNGVPGHPVVVGRSAWARLCTATGDEGGRRVLEGIALQHIDIDSDPPADVDDWASYERVRSVHG